MFTLRIRRIAWFVSLIVCLSCPVESSAARDVSLQRLGTYASGVFNSGGAEIVAYDAGT